MNELDKYFIFKARKGFKEKISQLKYPVNQKEYQQRLEYELGVITSLGFAGYFLVVQDFIHWARRNGIGIGPGRGSVGGSLCAFCLGITSVDPIKYGLIFERFLDISRGASSPPDIDTDVSKERRTEVIEYLASKYGKDKIAQIGTFGTFKPKKAIKDMARTLDYPLAMGNMLSKLYPKPVHGKEVALKDALVQSKELADFYNSNSEEGIVLRWAEKIEGRAASFGVHAAGIVISDQPIIKTVPLALGKHNEVVTQWDMKHVEEAGLIKFDLLGLKTLDVITKSIEFIKKNHNVDIDIENIDLDDKEVYANLCRGDVAGVFQLESSSGIKDLTIKVKPTSIEDLSLVLASYRPGPLGSPKMQEYLSWRNGGPEPAAHHPHLKKILYQTGQWMIYQEQILQIAKEMAGYSLVEANQLRKSIGKKNLAELLKNKEKFIQGFKKNGYTEQLATTVWDEILSFADYGFCLHSDQEIITDSGLKKISNIDTKQDKVAYWKNNKIEYAYPKKVWESGQKQILEITLEDNSKIFCTKDHKFLFQDQWLTAESLITKGFWEVFSEEKSQ